MHNVISLNKVSSWLFFIVSSCLFRSFPIQLWRLCSARIEIVILDWRCAQFSCLDKLNLTYFSGRSLIFVIFGLTYFCVGLPFLIVGLGRRSYDLLLIGLRFGKLSENNSITHYCGLNSLTHRPFCVRKKKRKLEVRNDHLIRLFMDLLLRLRNCFRFLFREVLVVGVSSYCKIICY